MSQAEKPTATRIAPPPLSAHIDSLFDGGTKSPLSLWAPRVDMWAAGAEGEEGAESKRGVASAGLAMFAVADSGRGGGAPA